ncbi:MAG: hypothetical protein ABIO43_00815 [Sphingomicrobium sp.]
MSEIYFLRRLLEERRRAEEATDPAERAVHLRTCHHYAKMLVSTKPEVSVPPASDE